MNISMMLFMITLFYVLTPGIFVTLPNSLQISLPETDKYTVALVHAIIFGLIYMIAHKMVLQITSDNNVENFFGGLRDSKGNLCTTNNSTSGTRCNLPDTTSGCLDINGNCCPNGIAAQKWCCDNNNQGKCTNGNCKDKDGNCVTGCNSVDRRGVCCKGFRVGRVAANGYCE